TDGQDHQDDGEERVAGVEPEQRGAYQQQHDRRAAGQGPDGADAGAGTAPPGPAAAPRPADERRVLVVQGPRRSPHGLRRPRRGRLRRQRDGGGGQVGAPRYLEGVAALRALDALARVVLGDVQDLLTVRTVLLEHIASRTGARFVPCDGYQLGLGSRRTM